MSENDSKFKIAIDKWFDSNEGKTCRDGNPTDVYLRNRLYLAFSAGWTAAMEEIKELIGK